MATYPYAEEIDYKIRDEIALMLCGANVMWEQGRAASPSTLDFVLIADRVLERYLLGEYIGSTPEECDEIAEALLEEQSAGNLNDWNEMADYIIDSLVGE